jgi:acyl carrier protein
VNEIRDRLRSFICTELLGDPSYPLEDDEPLVSGGLIDSFTIAHLAVFIEQQFGVYIADVDLTMEKTDTLRQIAEVIRGTREGMGAPEERPSQSRRR